MQKKISVIIPVYNVEAYLKECLDSIISQDLDDIEIICVNDGSTDGSLSILERYAEKDERIIIINQQNSGPSPTRNKGLEIAQGEYIFIPDSDDYLLTSNALSLLYTTASQYDLDIVSFDFRTVGGEEQEYRAKHKTGITDGKCFLQNGTTDVMVWCKFYKRAYLNSIHFSYSPISMHEDDEALPRLYVNAKRVSHLHVLLYAYRQRPNSLITQKISLTHFLGLKSIIETYNALLIKESDINFQKYLKRQLYYSLFRFYTLLLVNKQPDIMDMYTDIKTHLSFSKFELFLINNDERYIQYTDIDSHHKFSHPIIYALRKLRKIVFKLK
jgi:glycosyltransferase involved in cell wall biosynthesis